MINFEYLLRYYLKSSTLKLLDVKKVGNSSLEREFFERFHMNECVYGTFIKKDRNNIVPLLNLPIDFNETQHIIFYGIIAPGKTIYADKKHSLEFLPNDGFENFIIYDTDLKTISDYENISETESDDHIEVSEICESQNIHQSKKPYNKKNPRNSKFNDSLELDKEFQVNCGIDKSKISMKLQQILDEYKQMGYEAAQDSSITEKSVYNAYDILEKKENFANESTENFLEDAESSDISYKQHQVMACKSKDPLRSQLKKKRSKDSYSESEEIFFTTIVDNEVDIRKFSYVIKDHDRILPLYELEFKFDINFELKSRKGNICERCEKNDATMFCVAERAAFCEECDKKIHFDSFTKRHIRHYYSNLGKKQKFFHCMEHSTIIVDYFCEECQMPLCTECRLNGSHFNHRLITYFEADKSANLLKNKDFSTFLVKNEKCINQIRLEVSKFRKNIFEVQNDLEIQYQGIKKELDLFIKKKYQIFNARYLEFWKENRSIMFTSDFINNLDNSEIIKNYSTILNQQNLQIKEEFKAKYRSIFLHGTLSLKKLQEEGFHKNRSFQVEKTKELYAESSASRSEKL